jgi:hypothetical protein
MQTDKEMMSIIRHNYYCMTSHMPDSGTLSKVPCANNELEMDTSDELDELKIDTFDKLDELLRTVEKRDLAAFRRFNFICNVDDNDSNIDGLELRMARLLDALPQLQMLQLYGPRLRTKGNGGVAATSNRRQHDVLHGVEDCHLGQI